jgi:hypothetical protein
LVGGQSTAHGIDAECKETVELSVETLRAEDVIAKQIPIERLKVSYIKDDAVTLGDWALIESILANQREKLIASAASVDNTRQNLVLDGSVFSGNEHSVVS